MTLNELRYIVALNRERHFNRAAVACFVSQPSLSIALKKMEEELGVALFERGGAEVIPTAVGAQIVLEAEAILQRVASIKHLASSAHDPLKGSLRLGLIYTVAPYLLPQLVRELMQQAPNLSLRLQENFTHRLLELVREGELDAAIMAAPVPANFTQIDLYDEPFYVAVPCHHPWAQRSSIDYLELADQTLLLLGQGHCFRDQVLQVCPEAEGQGFERSFVEGVTLETIRHTVSSGYGISVLPATARIANDALLRYIPFQSGSQQRRIVIVTRKEFSRQAAIDVLQQAVQRCALEGVRYIQP